MCDLEDRYAQFKETIDSLREAHGFEKNHLRVGPVILIVLGLHVPLHLVPLEPTDQ